LLPLKRIARIDRDRVGTNTITTSCFAFCCFAFCLTTSATSRALHRRHREELRVKHDMSRATITSRVRAFLVDEIAKLRARRES
jgi:hypothetical protein